MLAHCHGAESSLKTFVSPAPLLPRQAKIPAVKKKKKSFLSAAVVLLKQLELGFAVYT